MTDSRNAWAQSLQLLNLPNTNSAPRLRICNKSHSSLTSVWIGVAVPSSKLRVRSPPYLFSAVNDTLSFLFYVTDVLVPQLNREMVVVMDNLNLHTTDAVRQAIENTGAKLVFLPTYSPDLSPIEMFWSKVKSVLRSIAPRTTEEIHAAITKAFNSVSTSNLFGWFYECDARTVLI